MSTSRTAKMTSKVKEDIIAELERSRGIKFPQEQVISSKNIPEILLRMIKALKLMHRNAEAEALEAVHEKVTDDEVFGGLGIVSSTVPTPEQSQEVLFLVRAWLKSIEYREVPLTQRISDPSAKVRKPMTLAQKILYHHIIGPAPEEGIGPGSVFRTSIDWVLASELSWSGMARTHESIGAPGIWRNDRFWLAGDHVVHPDIRNVPKIKAYVETAEKAKKDFQMTEYQGMNYTIMHTEFVRERAEPGMLCVGSDSHSCSAGAVGCLSIGLGVADVMMALSLGETWFKVPDSVRIELTGEPAFGISGKDVILHLLRELKRNTVASERVIEFDGDGVKYLSCDARFAISNMCTEFGAITGVFVPDEITKPYIDQRRCRRNKSNSIYFKPDPDAEYVDRYRINLSAVEPTIARYPNPDDVVPVSEMAGTPLDGVFIGACTTTEEELILGALVLQVGLKKKLPLNKGKRHYVPGSLPIVEALRKLGLLEIYEAAGFTRGPPGCSMCLGLSVEKASAGETWLSSQNRNFKNRMGPGSFGHLSSAVVCAASAFSMKITSPVDFLSELDADILNGCFSQDAVHFSQVSYVEPQPRETVKPAPKSAQTESDEHRRDLKTNREKITSKVVTLGDFIDTDALAPGESLISCTSDEEFGQYVLKHTHPDFRETVRNGSQVVVAGRAFGVGSSRGNAVSALKGAGVKAVIARSFAFIYSRNQPNLGLLGFRIDNEDFYQYATDGADIEIDIEDRKYNLTSNNGAVECYKQYGKGIWAHLTRRDGGVEMSRDAAVEDLKPADTRLQW